MKKVIRKVGAGFLALLMVLQALNSTMVVVAEELKKIDLAAPYGEYYNVDLQPEVVDPGDSEGTDDASSEEPIEDERGDTIKDAIDSEEVVEDASEEPKTILTKEASVYELESQYEGYPEVEEKRTVNSKTYDLGNGLYVEELFFEAIHKEVNGELEELDNTLEGVGALRSAVPIYQNKDGIFDFSVTGSTATINNSKNQAIDWTYANGDFSRHDVKENVILFTEVFENIDVEYVVRGEKVFTSYIINNRLDTDIITYQISLNGLKAKQEEEYIDLLDQD